mgnify:CR=1 FL=1
MASPLQPLSAEREEASAPVTEREVAYLRAISELSRDGVFVSTSEVARRMRVRGPTAIEAIRRLYEKGYVTYVPRRGAALTGRGKALLASIERRHRVLETFLVRVFNLDLNRACAEASRLELHISDYLVDLMCRYLGHPRRCPHGRAIPVKVTCCLSR